MKEHSVSIAESKKSLSRIIDDAVNHKKEVIVTRRGKPVAVIVPYDEYLQSQKRDALAVIMKTRQAFRKTGVGGEKIAKNARKELETRL